VTDLGITTVRDRRPLAVQVYDRLYDALVKPERLGSEVPTENELVDQLGVSRTTVRQALSLLEEDGVLERGAGRRRIVAQRNGGASGINPPLEEMILSSSPVTVQPIARRIAPATRWGSGLLNVEHETALVTWESLLSVDGRVVASALELTTTDLGRDLQPASEMTMLSALGPEFRRRSAQVHSRLSPHAAEVRGQFDGGIGTDAGAVVLTTVLSRQGRPAYLAKHVVRLGDVSLELQGLRSSARAM